MCNFIGMLKFSKCNNKCFTNLTQIKLLVSFPTKSLLSQDFNISIEKKPIAMKNLLNIYNFLLLETVLSSFSVGSKNDS